MKEETEQRPRDAYNSESSQAIASAAAEYRRAVVGAFTPDVI